MKALSKLQSTIITQAAASEDFSRQMNDRARQFVAAGVIIAAAMAAAPGAKAQVLTPSRCAAVGATVAGTAGASSADSQTSRIVAGALLGLGGAAVGEWLCSPKPKRQSDIEAAAARYGLDESEVRGGKQARQALSLSERERLDDLQSRALTDKALWKKSLVEVANLRHGGVSPAAAATVIEKERQARMAFESSRDQFASTVALMHNGSEGGAPRSVSRYLEVSGALLELSTEKKLTYEQIEARDEHLKRQNPHYAAEVERNFRSMRPKT